MSGWVGGVFGEVGGEVVDVSSCAEALFFGAYREGGKFLDKRGIDDPGFLRSETRRSGWIITTAEVEIQILY